MNSAVLRDRDFAKEVFKFKYPDCVLDEGMIDTFSILNLPYLSTEGLRLCGNLKVDIDVFVKDDFVSNMGITSYSEVIFIPKYTRLLIFIFQFAQILTIRNNQEESKLPGPGNGCKSHVCHL